MTAPPPVLDEQTVAAAIGAHVGEPVGITELVRLKGGYSREMHACQATIGAAPPRPLILCVDNPDGVVDATEALDRVQEYELLRALAAQGLQVPPVLCAGDGSGPLGRPYLVMDRVAGETAVGPLVRAPHYIELHDDFATQKASILAALHGVPVPWTIFGSDRVSPADCAAREVDRWRSALDTAPEAASTAVQCAADWLSSHLPRPPERVVIVHGDFRTGNLMYGPEGIRAVLDWEMAHSGDPLEDLGFSQLVLWRIGTDRVGGLVSPARWVSLYERAAGRSVDRDALRFWEVLAAVKMAVLTRRAAAALDPGKERDLLTGMGGILDEDLGRRLLPAGSAVRGASNGD